MRMRTQVLGIGFGILLAVAPLAGVQAQPEEEGQSGVQKDAGPPSITYPGSRSSKSWVTKPDGTRVAVGKGLEWKGVKVYLSLLWDLVGVDAKTGTTLYAANVGAFWNAFGFKEVETPDGKKVWAVELRPGPRTRVGADRRQYHDLRTGARLRVRGQETLPSGTRLKPRAVWSGAHSRIAKPFRVLVSSAGNWKTLQARMFGTEVPAAFRPIDFRKEIVLVLSSGDGWNSKGIGLDSAFEDDARILVRTQRHTFQTMGGGQQARPYGVFVLPRCHGKAYVVERNRQNLIGGPALWAESWRLARLGPVEDELKDLPPGTDTAHDRWIK